MGIKSTYMGVKKVVKITPLGEQPLGYEIQFEDVEAFDEDKDLSSYRHLKDAIERLAPAVQVNTTRCQEGIISFVTVGLVNEVERSEVVNSARDNIVEALESGYAYTRLADICAEFCREENPRINVRKSDHIDCVAIEYWQKDVDLNPEALRTKVEQINFAAKGAFYCTEEPCYAPNQISLMSVYDYQSPGEYRVRDAIAEIVELLEASCPKNEKYDPNYIRKMMV